MTGRRLPLGSKAGYARSGLPVAILTLVCLLAPRHAGGFYVPFPNPGFDAVSSGVLALIVMDRDLGEVALIPTLRLGGTSADYVLVVPTPSLPEIAPAHEEIWTQAARLTAPPSSRRGSDGPIFDCVADDPVKVPVDAPPPWDVLVPWGPPMIHVIREATCPPEDPGAMARWLGENGYTVTDAQAASFSDFAERGWYLTIMRPDSASAEIGVPPWGWDHNVAPLTFRFAADQLELPLPLLAVNRRESFLVDLYVIDDHRVTLAGFETMYVNRLNESEVGAIEELYPALSGCVAPGRCLTRLRRVFRYDDSMSSSLRLERAPSDEEVRFSSWEPGWRALTDLAVLPLPLLLYKGLLAGRRRRKQGRPAAGPRCR